MILQQISVFLENRAGQLAEITGLLSENGIDLRALNIAESSDYGVLRLIVSDPAGAQKLLHDAGTLVSLTPVVAVAVPDRPGGLCALLKLLAARNIDISYMYSIFGQKNGMAHMIFRVADPEIMEALLKDSGFTAEAAELGIF